MHSHRDKLLQKLRRQKVNKILQTERTNLYRNQLKQTQQQFTKIYPTISPENYHTHKAQLAHFVVHSQYTYQIVGFAGLVYDYLMDGERWDGDSWKILKWVTQYQDVQVPQTEELAELLLMPFQNMAHDQGSGSHLNSNISSYGSQQWTCRDTRSQFIISSIVICSNLLWIPKYQSLLKTKLIQNGLLDKLDQVVRYPTQYLPNYNFKSIQHIVLISQIYASLLSSNPLASMTQLQKIVTHTHRLMQMYPDDPQVNQNILGTFTQIRQKIKTNNKYARLLMNSFWEFAIKHRYGVEGSLFDLLYYAARSGVWVGWQQVYTLVEQVFIHNYWVYERNTCADVRDGASEGASTVIQSVLQCIQIYITESQEQMQISNQLIQKLLIVLSSTGTSTSRCQTILGILVEIDRQQIVQAIDQLKNKNTNKTLQQLTQNVVQKLIECLQRHDTYQVTIRLLKSILVCQLERQQQLGYCSGVRQIFESLGGRRKLEDVYERTSGQNKESGGILEDLDDLIDMFQHNHTL